MAVYNGARFLHAAISSVLAQSYRDFELIVVDDASVDHSVSILTSFADPRIRIIKHESNMGASLSRNHALAAARGELVAIMDADDLCTPTRLEKQVKFLDANPRVGVVGCAIYDNIDSSGTVLHTSYLPQENEAIQRTLMERWCFLHSSLVFRKALYDIVGGYRGAFEPAEDHDFVLRIAERCEARNLGERLVSYRLTHDGLSVVGHRYVTQFREVAIRLAERRRGGHREDADCEMAHLCQLRRNRKDALGFSGMLEKWRDSLYTANRYYDFARWELGAGHIKTARRCFVSSLRANWLFLKSWIGIALSIAPVTFGGLKFAFQSATRVRRLLARVGNRRQIAQNMNFWKAR
jgi:glycosyltransferase involved in cell wall biosynthesis